MKKRIQWVLAVAVVILGLIAIAPAARAVGDLSTEAHDALRLFTHALAVVEMKYVEDVPVKELVYGAITGMLESLDPHSSFLTPESFSNLTEETTGKFGGLGIEIQLKDGYIAVISPIDDTPAARAGIKAGDLIVKIEGEITKGMTIMDAVNKLRGDAGTTVTVTIWREGVDKPFEVTLERAIIDVVTVKDKMLEPGYVYVRLTQFNSNATDHLRMAIERLAEQGPIKGLVLDLRNNPGGLLDQAVNVADEFLDDGLIVYTHGRIESQDMSFAAKPNGTYSMGPMVVLINAGSASASEIVAGALKDQHRAILIGGRTFGKGSVQTILPLDSDTALRLTTAKYFTPSGRDIQAKGVEPHYVIAPAADVEPDFDDEMFRESDYRNRLPNLEEENGTAPPPSVLDEQQTLPKPPSSADESEDPQLDVAVAILKSWPQYSALLGGA
ncbi:S41 family peptidase [bacterium]|nr:S41 family peptidase [bacterium]